MYLKSELTSSEIFTGKAEEMNASLNSKIRIEEQTFPPSSLT